LSEQPAEPSRVLVIGDVMIDLIVRPEGALAIGSDRRATIFSRPGGSAANQAVWLAHFGLNVSFVGRRRRRSANAASRPRSPPTGSARQAASSR
jgi:hypothetical protein